MGQRSRKRKRSEGGDAPAARRATPGPRPPRPSSSEQADAARARLEPLTPTDRPAPLLIAIALVMLLGLINTALYFAGTKIQGKHPGAGVLAFSLVMFVAGIGMYQLRYWAVLGFQALLALIVLVFGLFLVRASNIEALVLSVAVIGLGGWLFWKMVSVMARIQLPTRPGSR
ncbi:MAG: hypothetical protein ACR2ND_02035 [Solirubrobacteraceae bacterium]